MGKESQKLQRGGRRASSSARTPTTATAVANHSAINREFSSGGVVFRRENDQILWLIRKTASSDLYPKQYWMLPKGRIDDTDEDEPGPMASGKVRADQNSLQSAALREVGEETGVGAKIVEKVGTVKYSYIDPNRGKILKFITFFLMEWVEDLHDSYDHETSEISWLPFEEAYKLLSFSSEKQTLEKAKGILDSGIQDSLV